jgi:hypothetical protein
MRFSSFTRPGRRSWLADRSTHRYCWRQFHPLAVALSYPGERAVTMKRLWPGSIAEIEQPKQNPAGPCFEAPSLGAVGEPHQCRHRRLNRRLIYERCVRSK